MCIARCGKALGILLIPLALVSMLANTLLLFPNLQSRYLREGHITKYATLGTGLWASGLLVLPAARVFITSSHKKGRCGFRSEMLCSILYAVIAMAGATLCFVTSGTALVEGPLCKYNETYSNGTQEQVWGTPLEHKTPSPSSWEEVCLEPQGVVLWNVVLFSTLLASSGTQALLCIIQVLNAILGFLCGPDIKHNKNSIL
uniref:Transmembrane 4 L six family member 19 n=1 Tax=Lepisosteus oculatus TaxID=7918 RepID=W5MUA5_LEPOC